MGELMANDVLTSIPPLDLRLVSFGVTGWAPYWLMASCWRTAKQAGRADKNSRPQVMQSMTRNSLQRSLECSWKYFHASYRHILSILPVLILASVTHPWPRHQYQPPLPEVARLFEDAKKRTPLLAFPDSHGFKRTKSEWDPKKMLGYRKAMVCFLLFMPF